MQLTKTGYYADFVVIHQWRWLWTGKACYLSRAALYGGVAYVWTELPLAHIDVFQREE